MLKKPTHRCIIFLFRKKLHEIGNHNTLRYVESKSGIFGKSFLNSVATSVNRNNQIVYQRNDTKSTIFTEANQWFIFQERPMPTF